MRTFDGFTLVLFCVPLTSGWFQYTLGPTVDILRVEQGITRQVASLLGTASAVGGMIAALVSVMLIGRFGRRRVLVWGSVGCAVGVVVLTAGSGFGWSLAGVFVVGVARILAMNSMTSGLSLHHGLRTGPVLSHAYALTSAVGILAPLALSVVVATGLGWRPGFFFVLAFSAVLVLGVWVQPSSPVLDEVQPQPRRSPKRRPKKVALGRPWYWLLVTMCASVSAEWATIYWSADLIRSQAHVLASVAALGTSALLLGQFLGRIAFGRLAERQSPVTLIIVMVPISLAGWLLLWLATDINVALVGAFIMGVGISAVFPFLLTMMIEHSHDQPDRSIALSGLATGVSVAVAPFVLASISDWLGPFIGFLFVPIALLGALVTVLVARVLLQHSAAPAAE